MNNVQTRPAGSTGGRGTAGGTRAVWSWALYDFANSPFTTLSVTFIYAAYFTQAIAPDPETGTVLWSRGVTVTALVVAFASPLLGAFADRGGYRKRLLGLLTAATIVGSIALYPMLPGQVLPALIVFVAANICFELAGVLYNAFLTDLAPPDRIGRVSGFGWGLGYVGGLLALIVALTTLIMPETPWFGLTTEAGQNIRASNLLVAAWFAVFSLPLFLFVREPAALAAGKVRGGVLGDTARQLAATFRDLGAHRQMVRFLIARLLYNDGLVTIFAFGGIYAAGTFGFTVLDILLFGIVLNVAAGLGSFVMGRFDDLLGGKRTIQMSLIALVAATVMLAVAPGAAWLWAAGIVVGVSVGPNQSASRSLMGRFVPVGKENAFFGFFAFSGKATAFLGPLMFGVLTETFGTQRAGVAIVLALFAAGLFVLAGVDEERGKQEALDPGAVGGELTDSAA